MPKSTTTTILLADMSQAQFSTMIYEFRGQMVMLDSDLAQIYGYTTSAFNRQVKNNIDKFDEEDFMFQLTAEETSQLSKRKFCTTKTESCSQQTIIEECDNALTSSDTDVSNGEFLRCKNYTSKTETRGGRQYRPYAFTEQGIYMLMTVLRGPLATRQTKALIRLFKGMKDYIISSQPLLGQREYLQLSLQTSQNIRDIMDLRSSLARIDDRVAQISDSMGQLVTQSELSNIMLDFGNPVTRRGWLILQGQPVESDLAYQQIYSQARHTVFVYDNYINLKTLALLKDIPTGVLVTIISDNVQNKLHLSEYNDFLRQYPHMRIQLLQDGNTFHDRYIVIDYDTPEETIYHCGASSKDGGNKVMTIEIVSDRAIYHPLIDSTLQNAPLMLR